MDGIVGLFFALLFVAAGLVLAGVRRRQLAADHASRHCLHCQTPISMRRPSWFKSLLFLAAWECPHCGNRRRSRTGTA